jgi:hypothetical protein
MKVFFLLFECTAGFCRQKKSSWFKCGYTKTQNNHGCLTAGTFKNRSGALFNPFNDNVQNQLNEQQQFFGITMKEAIVSDSPEPFGQNMQDDQIQKILAALGAIACIAGFAINIRESYLAILIGNNVFFTDHAAV